MSEADEEGIPWRYRFVNKHDGIPVEVIKQGFSSDGPSKAKSLFIGSIVLVFYLTTFVIILFLFHEPTVLELFVIPPVISIVFGTLFGMLQWSLLFHVEAWLKLANDALCRRCGHHSHLTEDCNAKHPYPWFTEQWNEYHAKLEEESE